jgi:hypothetical protein
MVFKSFQLNNDLVSEDYYAKEIKFQDVIDKTNNAEALDENITWESANGGILVTFPELNNTITGEIILFRPSDKSKDLSFEIEIDENHQQFLTHENIIHGKYLIQIDWMAGQSEFYTEGSAYVAQ